MEPDAGTGRQDLEGIKEEVVASAIMRVHTFLHDLVTRLNRDKPKTKVNFPIDELGLFKGLIQCDYQLDFHTSPKYESVSLKFTLCSDTQFHFETVSGPEQEILLERLRKSGLSPKVVDEPDKSGDKSKLLLDGYVPAQIEFRTDFDDNSVILSIRNYENLSIDRMHMKPELITDGLLDEFAKYILRKDNQFLSEITVAENQITALQRIKDVTTGSFDAPSQTQELSSARLGLLSDQQPRLSLSYYDVIKEISALNSDFVIGRGEHSGLTVNAGFASRKHVRIVFRNGKFVLVDQSTNGTFVKPQGGEEVYLQREELPLSGSGLISLGKSISVSNEHLIYYFCH